MQGLDWDAIQAHEERLTRRLIDGLTSLAGVRLLGPVDTRDRRGVVTFSVDGFSADDVCRFLDDRGIALRGGYHCAQPLVRAFGVEGAARASLAPYSIDADVDGLLQGVEDLLGSRYQGASHRHEKPMRAG
jgi:cysteine desulfurase/selenocysteine lyase